MSMELERIIGEIQDSTKVLKALALRLELHNQDIKKLLEEIKELLKKEEDIYEETKH